MITRKTPEFTQAVNSTVTWVEMLKDYDVTQFPTGTKITAQDWNSLFVKATYQGNYTADSLKAFIENYYNPVVVRVNTAETNIIALQNADIALDARINTLEDELGDMGAILDIINGEVI